MSANSDFTTVFDACCGAGASPHEAESAAQSYLVAQMDGWDVLRKVTSRATFYRRLGVLKKAGFFVPLRGAISLPLRPDVFSGGNIGLRHLLNRSVTVKAPTDFGEDGYDVWLPSDIGQVEQVVMLDTGWHLMVTYGGTMDYFSVPDFWNTFDLVDDM